MRRLALAALLVLAVAPALAATRLPAAMLGTWAPEPKDCEEEEGLVKDSRIGVEPGAVISIADAWVVKVWRRVGDSYQGRAMVHDEGGEAPVRGRIALRLTRDGRLEITRDGYRSDPLIRCPKGVEVQ
jgi:hypothetical protein